jgi:hypothetical protein
MRLTGRTLSIATVVLAVAVFAAVQDRVTAAGARRYAAVARDAIAGGRQPPPIEEIMAPAIRSSMRWGGASALAILLVGLAASRRLI